MLQSGSRWQISESTSGGGARRADSASRWVRFDMGVNQAPVTVEQSSRGMVTVIEEALGQVEHRFLTFEVNTLDW